MTHIAADCAWFQICLRLIIVGGDKECVGLGDELDVLWLKAATAMSLRLGLSVHGLCGIVHLDVAQLQCGMRT